MWCAQAIDLFDEYVTYSLWILEIYGFPLTDNCMEHVDDVREIAARIILMKVKPRVDQIGPRCIL